MTKPRPSPTPYVQPYRYASPNIPLSAIKRLARRIAEKFRPEKIILFGSYAYGTPHEESDVDLLVIMPCRDSIDQSIKICMAFEREFVLDLIVRTPFKVARGLKNNNWFLREIIEKGKVLYDAGNSRVGPVRRGRHPDAMTGRYPGERAKTRQMQAALRQAETIRAESRSRLGLRP